MPARLKLDCRLCVQKLITFSVCTADVKAQQHHLHVVGINSGRPHFPVDDVHVCRSMIFVWRRTRFRTSLVTIPKSLQPPKWRWAQTTVGVTYLRSMKSENVEICFIYAPQTHLCMANKNSGFACHCSVKAKRLHLYNAIRAATKQ